MTPAFVPRADYAGLQAYRADRPRVDADLSDSTNQWGVAPSALDAIRAVAAGGISEYLPDSAELAAAASAYYGVPAECIVSGCGSDNVLDAAFRGLASPGDAVAFPAPTFAMIPILARINGLRAMPVPVRADGDVDADAILATNARLIYLCSPNNPSGTPHSRAAVERIIVHAPGAIILDEAYAEFATDVLTSRAPSFPHVLCTRTLSKSFGLAGLRIGFGIGSPAIVDEVLKSRGPYKVNIVADRAATAALRNDRPWVRAHVEEVSRVRERFRAALQDLGFIALPSEANFVCVPFAGARTIAERLYAHGIAVRAFSALPVLGDVIRIGLAPWPVLERVLAALRQVSA